MPPSVVKPFAWSLRQPARRRASRERPTWLDLAHKRLDEAVLAAYGWAPGISDEEILARLLELNLQRAEER